MSENSESVPLYTAGALQIACKAVNGCKDKESAFKVRMGTLERIKSYVNVMVNFVHFHNGSTVRLIVLPERGKFLLSDKWHPGIFRASDTQFFSFSRM